MHSPTQNVIDFHTHVFPDALAPRAIAQLTINAAASGYIPLTDGTVAGLLESMSRAGISRSVVCNIATNPRQMKKVNDFAISLLDDPRLIPLGSVNPEATAEEITAELNRLKEAGIPGIKIHPDYMKVEIDSKKFTPIFKACAERNLFVITHAGFDPVEPHHVHCTPDMVLRVMDRHPSLKLVVAHTGGFDREREVLEKLCGAPVWLDTSLAAIRRAKTAEWGALCAEILRKHTPDRILFATDTPWSDPAAEIAFVRSLALPEEVTEGILHSNAEQLIASCTHT
jgi:predicted TIM-barrel fold metal-dependent hydrolase